MTRLLFAAGVLALTMTSAPSARAQTEVTLVGPGGIRAAIEQLIPVYEAKTGNKVKATFGSGLGTKSRLQMAILSTCQLSSRPIPK
jgi:accessory colonization factor AcfC